MEFPTAIALALELAERGRLKKRKYLLALITLVISLAFFLFLMFPFASHHLGLIVKRTNSGQLSLNSNSRNGNPCDRHFCNWIALRCKMRLVHTVGQL
jgi:hypothetical protein